jgi:hypothetical protein
MKTIRFPDFSLADDAPPIPPPRVTLDLTSEADR